MGVVSLEKGRGGSHPRTVETGGTVLPKFRTQLMNLAFAGVNGTLVTKWIVGEQSR